MVKNILPIKLKIGFVLALLNVLFSCNVYKQYITQADAAMQEKNYNDAAYNYYNVLLLKPLNSKARNGLLLSAQQVLDEKFAKFSQLVLENNLPDAVKQYQYNQLYFNNVKSVGVNIVWPSMYKEVYEDIKDEYITKTHYTALQYITDKKYDKAEELFIQLSGLDSVYKNATVVRMNTVLEPLYQRGLRMIKSENYKEAFYSFDKILSFDTLYKNSSKLHEIAKQKASIYFAIIPTFNQTKIDKEDTKIYQVMFSQMALNQNTFIKILDKPTLEKQLSMKGLSIVSFENTASAIQAAKEINLKYILLSTLLDAQIENISPTNEGQIAYEVFNEKVEKSANGAYQFISRFKKINYTQNYKMRRVLYTVKYQLINIETGETEVNETISEEKKDEQTVATYIGDFKNLYPNLPAGNFMPETPNEWRNKFTETNKNLESIASLGAQCALTVASKIKNEDMLYKYIEN